MNQLNIQDKITLGALPPQVIHSTSYLHAPGFQGVIQRVSLLYFRTFETRNVELMSDKAFHAANAVICIGFIK